MDIFLKTVCLNKLENVKATSMWTWLLFVNLSKKYLANYQACIRHSVNENVRNYK